MAKIILQKQTEPTTPDAGSSTLYVDSADGKTKVKDEAGDVSTVASEEYVDSAINSNTTFFGGSGVDGIQGDENLTLTGDNDSYIVKNFSSRTAGSVARTCTITPTGCITHIKISGDADFTNRTFDFGGKGKAGGAGSSVNGGAGTSGVSFIGNGLYTGGGGYGEYNNGASGIGGINSLTSSNLGDIRNIFNFKYTGGAGGGGGSGGQSQPNPGPGGYGGGLLIIEVGGNIIYSTTTFDVSGNDGTDLGGGGGGGGVYIYYKGSVTGTLTSVVSGGAARSVSGGNYSIAGGGGAGVSTNGTQGTNSACGAGGLGAVYEIKITE